MSAVFALFAVPGLAFDKIDFRTPGADKALESLLRGASSLLGAERDGTTDAQNIFADAQAEYALLLNALYAAGYYSGVIHIYLDGREAAAYWLALGVLCGSGIVVYFAVGAVIGAYRPADLRAMLRRRRS